MSEFPRNPSVINHVSRRLPLALMAGLAVAGSIGTPTAAQAHVPVPIAERNSGIDIDDMKKAEVPISNVRKPFIDSLKRRANVYWEGHAPEDVYKNYITSGCYRNLNTTENSTPEEMLGGENWESGAADALSFIRRPPGDPDWCKIRINVRAYDDGTNYTRAVVFHEVGHHIFLDNFFDGKSHSQNINDPMYGPVSGVPYVGRTAEAFAATVQEDPESALDLPKQVPDKKILDFMALEASGKDPVACRTYVPKTKSSVVAPVRRFYCIDENSRVIKIAIKSNVMQAGGLPNATAREDYNPDAWKRNKMRGGKLVK